MWVWVVVDVVVLFFFKQKTAYEMRISDWSSDVCSSDLAHEHADRLGATGVVGQRRGRDGLTGEDVRLLGLADLRAVLARRTRRLVRRVAVLEIGRASCRERVCQYV